MAAVWLEGRRFNRFKTYETYKSYTVVSVSIYGDTAVLGARSNPLYSVDKFFTAQHWMQGGLVTRKMSVCPPVCQTRALWQNGRKICPDFYTIRKIT